MPRLLAGTHAITKDSEHEVRWQWAEPTGMWPLRAPRCPMPTSRPDSPFSLCWKEGENSLAVILAIRASSWAFWAAVRAASALAREWEVLGGERQGGGEGTQRAGQPLVPTVGWARTGCWAPCGLCPQTSRSLHSFIHSFSEHHWAPARPDTPPAPLGTGQTTTCAVLGSQMEVRP